MPQLNGGNATPAFVTFVKRLQESLSRMEEFEVVVASQGTHDSASDTSPSLCHPQLIHFGSAVDSRRSGTSMLGRQLRLRLIAEDADIPRSCTNIVVSIHAIATFESFNSYLRPRILAAQAQAERLSSGLASGSGGGTLSSLLAAFAAAAGADMDDDDEADETILSSSPPPRRAELSNLDNGASTSTDQRRSSSASRASKDAAPKRRRSSRLSGKGADSLDEPVASSSRVEETPDALYVSEHAPLRCGRALIHDEPTRAGPERTMSQTRKRVRPKNPTADKKRFVLILNRLKSRPQADPDLWHVS